MSRRVEGEGPKNPKLMLIGEAPGAEEEALGRPFVGKSGRLLDNMLVNAGIKREECYITNLVKERPPNNDFSKVKDLGKWGNELFKEIEEINPTLIVAIGGHSLKALSTHEGIDTLAGYPIYTILSQRMTAILHPAYLLRGQMRLKPLNELFLRKAKRWSESPSFPSYEHNFKWEWSSTGEILEALEGLKTSKEVSFDIETRGNSLTCCGFATSEERAIVIPFTKGIRNYWSVCEETEIWRGVASILEDPQVEKICHNAYFECSILARSHGIIIQNVFDTMVAHHELSPEMDKGLDDLIKIYTDRPFHKDMRDSTDEKLWEYNALDCVTTFECAQKIKNQLI